MNSQEFFAKAEFSLQHQLPFVLYRKPITKNNSDFLIQGFFQKNDQLYFAEDYTESGFVMAPFDLNAQKSPLIPADKAEKITINIPVAELIAEQKENTEISNETAQKENHLHLVKKGIQNIKNKNLDKVVLSRKITKEISPDVLAIFKRLLITYPTAFTYCWFHPKIGLWMGATPETLVKIHKEKLNTMALASTKPVEGDNLPKWTNKEIEEQQFVTDFIKETLAGNVNHLQIGKVENIKAGKLWHLKCDITAEMKS